MWIALYGKLAAVQQHYLSAEAEAYSAAFLFSGIEWQEYILKSLGCNAASVIGDCYKGLFVAYAGVNYNFAIVVTLYCLHCITQKVA